MLSLLSTLALAAAAYAQQTTFTTYDAGVTKDEPWNAKYGTQEDLQFTGPLSFSHLPYHRCLSDISHSQPFDIAILGFPFDTTTTYRPGARFGPFAIRSGSRRQTARGYTLNWSGTGGPRELGANIVDCGDIPITPFDNTKALDQMEAAYETLIQRPVSGGINESFKNRTSHIALDGLEHPRVVSLGGDHTIVLPILRALHKVYGPVSVIHFDSHTDTGAVEGMGGRERITHGSYFTIAYEEGLMTNNSIHGGIRQKSTAASYSHDADVGFQLISAEDIDHYGVEGIVKAIRKRVGDTPVYLSLDIDVIDPSQAPATGTPEAGGWTTREMKRILKGLAGLNFVGADLVEVAPAYDTADITGIAAADLVADFLVMMQVDAPPPKGWHMGMPDWDAL